jgi:hypothetical protein
MLKPALFPMLIALALVPQKAGDGARLFLVQNGYVELEHSHAAARGADYVFFADDPISARVEILNPTDSTLRLTIPQGDVTGLASLELLRLTESTEHPVDATFEPGEPRITARDGGVSPVSRSDTSVDLPPGWRLTVPGRLRSDSINRPGVYHLRVSSVFAGCEPACSVLVQAERFRFEVRRAAGVGERLDQLFRRAFDRIERSDFQAADAIVNQMLTMYPSSAAYELRGMGAERRTDSAAAKEAYQEAARLLTTNEDRLRYEGRPEQRNQLAARLLGRAQALGTRRRPPV